MEVLVEKTKRNVAKNKRTGTTGTTLLKKKRKFSSYIRKFRRDQQIIYEEGLLNIYQEMRKYLVIYED